MIVEQGKLTEDLSSLVLLLHLRIATFLAFEAAFFNNVEDIATVSFSDYYIALLHASGAYLRDELKYALM